MINDVTHLCIVRYTLLTMHLITGTILFMIGLGLGLPLAAVQASYTATINSQEGIDQADSTIPNTIAWHLVAAQTDGGGIIYLQPGVYQLGSALVMPDQTTLAGTAEGVILQATGEEFADHLIKNNHSDHPLSDGVHDITLKHLTFIGQRAVRLNCVQFVGSEAQRSSDIALYDITTRDCGRHGIHIKGANHLILKNIVSYDNGFDVDHDHNVYLLRVTDATVQHVITYRAAGNGFSSTRLVQATLSDIVSTKNGRRGIRFGAGRNILLYNCVVRKNGLALDHQADGIVIVMDDYGNLSANITIKKCTIAHNRDYGIWITGATNVVLKNNLMHHNVAGNTHFMAPTVLKR